MFLLVVVWGVGDSGVVMSRGLVLSAAVPMVLVMSMVGVVVWLVVGSWPVLLSVPEGAPASFVSVLPVLPPGSSGFPGWVLPGKPPPLVLVGVRVWLVLVRWARWIPA
ncbi:hypothetical protein ACIOWI_35620, partial [Streptomyces sp. NPDC087659]|uniref:hypothetical protein n=1 Tax=Streptomyces sp. NPDC087659 TaxID=3365801 RepID=UPI00382A701E